MPGVDETENHFRARLRDPGDFTRLRTIPFKRSKPRINAVVGRLRGSETTTVQSLLFPKEDGWTRDAVQAWLRDHPDVGKAAEIEEVRGAELEAAGILPAPPSTEDLWEAAVKSAPAAGLVRKTYSGEAKQVNEDAFEVDIVISTGSVDRDREVVRPEGMRLPKPKRLPLVAAHAYGDLRKHIGELTRVKADDGQVTARARYFAGMGNEEADWAWTLVKLGVPAYSIGFRPLKWEDADLEDEKVVEAVRAGKKPIRTFTEWELLETSHVIVPSQREAVAREVEEAVTKGVIDQPFADRIAKAVREAGEPEDQQREREMVDDFISEVLGEEVGRDAVAAHYAFAAGKDARWAVAGARGLPILDDEAWDADGAVAAWRRFTGATGAEALKDRAVQRRYRRGFLLYDAAAPAAPASYKFPFVKVDGGRVTASRRGLAAARAVLAGGKGRPDVGEALAASCARFVDGYLGKPEEEGRGIPLQRVAELNLAVLKDNETDTLVLLGEDGDLLYRGAPAAFEEMLELAMGRAPEIHQRLTLDVRPVEIATDGLESWAAEFVHLLTSQLNRIAASIAEGAPKAPTFPADSVAHLTRKELAEIILQTALKAARQEIGKATGDVDAYR